MKNKIFPIIIATIASVFFATAIIILILDKNSYVKECNNKISSLNEKMESINNEKKDKIEYDKQVIDSCSLSLKNIKDLYINRNISNSAKDNLKNFITQNMFNKMLPNATYYDVNGNIITDGNLATTVAYIFQNKSDGLFYTNNVTYGNLELIVANENYALTSIEQKDGQIIKKFYPVFIKEGDNWKLEAF